MCSPEVRKKSEKNIKKVKKTFEHDILPLCRGGPARPIFTIFGVWGHTADVITPVEFQVDWSKGVGSIRVPKVGCFPLTLIVALTTVLRTTVLHCDKNVKQLILGPGNGFFMYCCIQGWIKIIKSYERCCCCCCCRDLLEMEMGHLLWPTTHGHRLHHSWSYAWEYEGHGMVVLDNPLGLESKKKS